MRKRRVNVSSVQYADEQTTVQGRFAAGRRFVPAVSTRGLAAISLVPLLLAAFFPGPAMGQTFGSTASGAGDLPTEASKIPGIKDYLDTSEEPIEVASLGIKVRDGRATLNDGQSISGAQVIDVLPRSPVAQSLGSHEVSHLLVSGALIGAGVASAVLFPPAIVAVAMIAHRHIGMTYDLVVGVDGFRIRNTIDLMQSIANVRPGDTLYVVVIRRGRRIQVPVHLPESG